MKKFFSVLVLCLGILMFGFTKASYAADKQHEIESASFDVNLREDGSVFITETWNLNFKKGDFTRFTIDRLKNPNEMEKFDSIEVQSFKINGKECDLTSDLENRPEGTYSIVDSRDKIEYAWYFRANNEKLTLTNSYIVTNVVKANEMNNYAFFCYRFIGKDFSTKFKI